MEETAIKPTLIKIYWFLASQLGFDILRFLGSLRGFPHFFRTWRQFKRRYSGRMLFMPCLYDRYLEGGTTKSEYFWQDLLVARWVHAAQPARHVDVGSRVDGFVAHLAAFREVEVFDVRSITSQVPGVVFRQADMMDPQSVSSYAQQGEGYCDSLSCLHALEHFGLGRYGDPVDPLGYRRGISNMSRLLKQGGTFYLSVPVGSERVEFNAHRVFDPREVITQCGDHGLALTRLTVVRPDSTVSELLPDAAPLALLANEPYALGIFVFQKQVAQ